MATGCGLIGLLSAPAARTAEWSLGSELGQQFSYEENIGLDEGGSEGSQVSGFSSTSSIGLSAAGRTPTFDISLTSLFNFTFFPTQSELDSNDQYITLFGERRGERWAAALTGQYIRDTTRTSDVEETGDFILANKRREFYSIGPAFSYRLTPTDQANLSAFYNYNHYDTKQIPDSANMGAQVGWVHDLTLRTQTLVNVFASKINSNDTAEGNDNSRYYALLMGASHKFSENLTAGLRVGPTIAETDVVEPVNGTRLSESGTHVGYAFDLNLTYALEELISLQSNFFRSLEASSSTGELSEDTGLRVAASYQVFPELFVDLPVIYIHRDAVGEQLEDDDTEARDYAAIEPTLRWRFTPGWDFRLGYGFQWEQTDEGHGFGNSVFAFLTYRLPRLSMSR